MRRSTAVVVTAVAAGFVAVVLWSRRTSRTWRRAERIVRRLDRVCATPAAKLWRIADAMAAEMRAGLDAPSGGSSSLKMLVSLIGSLPTGDEQGLFYGLNLGRASLSLMRVQLGGKEARVIKKEHLDVPVPSSLRVGTSDQLFDYIARELAKFVSEDGEPFHAPDGRRRQLGVTFSFPVRQSSHASVEWNGGFSIQDAVGKDVVTELNGALEKHGVDMHVFPVVNDTIGTLAGGRYCNGDTVAAIMLGMGTNAAYVEPLDAASEHHRSLDKSNEMVINLEWGNFHSPYLPITEFDVQLDTESSSPHEQILEKLISGMYLGDIVRRVLLRLAEETVLFGDSIPPKLRIPFSLRTPDMASIHQDTSEGLEVVGEKLEAFGIYDTTLRTREIVVAVCDIITRRAARLAGAGMVGILEKLGRDGTYKASTIVVEGCLYEHYRLFRNYLQSGVKEMLQGKYSDKVLITQPSDVCQIGAALLAASNLGLVSNS